MSYHVLVVEDDAVTRSKLVGYFQNEGYHVSEAESGEQMRESLQNNAIDLVMLDINLPGEDGLMLTRELRSQSDIGIILVTGRTDSIDKIVGLEMGADDYVTKPFELRELLVRVKTCFGVFQPRAMRREQLKATSKTVTQYVLASGHLMFSVER